MDDEIAGDDFDDSASQLNSRRRVPSRRLVILAAMLLVTTLAIWGLLRGSDPPTPSSSATSVPLEVVPAPEGTTLIANLSRDIDAYSEPRGDVTGTVSANWHGRASSLPVINQEPGWLQVRLAPRPNGSTAWVRRKDVELTSTPYRIEIDVASMRLHLYNRGEMVLDAPAGIGLDETPTTVGNFFVAFLQEAPSPDWGPYVMVTSAHSETISDWEESGDAIIAIHGPLDSDDEIGDAGAKVSAGCVRLHLDAIEALRDVPAGSPIDIISGPTTT